ncbi:hypothetical protein Y032_0010g1027 [Ancylostoma ceylanicum]|uniref:Uncharacterized protein n=1 Tax=Ancylostoma ceylanicum TaxID=53326 RepID=A0A016VF17_9BILA|nr:hypothetical protein Y032_0010g1027 [Ancylostoma ceylanicum]
MVQLETHPKRRNKNDLIMVHKIVNGYTILHMTDFFTLQNSITLYCRKFDLNDLHCGVFRSASTCLIQVSLVSSAALVVGWSPVCDCWSADLTEKSHLKGLL